MRKQLAAIYYSFPVQLLVLHIRSHHLLTGMWIILFLLVGAQIGERFGMHYLFIEPEYLGQTSFLSYFILGMAFGCFFLTWNLTAYLLSAHHFPFLATLFRPFTKFCYNNFIIPISFLVFYLFIILLGESTIGLRLLYIAGFFLGILFLVFLYFLYFNRTNRDISYYTPKIKQAPDQIKSIKPGRRNVDLNYIKKDRNHWKVKTYLGEAFKIRLVRSVAHYDSLILLRIFKQNHLNALVIQLATILLLMSIGLLTDYPIFRLPAGASILFLLSIITAVIGALTYWFSNWVISGLIALVLLVNFATSHNIAYHDNKAYGLDYSVEPVPYEVPSLEQIIQPQQVATDKANTEAILEKWKAKQLANNPEVLPKMVIVSSSGGGLSSATWVMHSLLTADSLMDGQLLSKMVLMTGASGGVLGSAYLRELMLQKENDQTFQINRQEGVNNISKDLLNSITFMLVAHDLSFPWATFKYGEDRYYKDRAYIFEKQFNENTDFVLDKSLGDYAAAEQAANIPLLYITPAILNDGRKLYISSQGVSFMMTSPIGVEEPDLVEIDGVDFRALFKAQSPDSLRYLSALRMSATFPYILPSVHLPSQPSIEVMDAGFLDNYGLKSSIRFIQVFKDWILANTSGVVLLQISASSKIETIGTAEKKGIITSLLGPIEMAGNLFVRQEFEHNNSLGFLYDLLGKDYFHHLNLRYNYQDPENQNATISFHLTEKEKRQIQGAFNSTENQAAFKQLQKLMIPPVSSLPSTVSGHN
ncbi:MAG: hypothetical protein Sapg2KO_22620 [Saprospiraceae bacterium]